VQRRLSGVVYELIRLLTETARAAARGWGEKSQRSSKSGFQTRLGEGWCLV